jgi:hypothetical protein
MLAAAAATSFVCGTIAALDGVAAPGGQNHIASAAVAPFSTPAAPRGATCPGTLVEVSATTSEEVQLACAAAALAHELLAPCQLSLRRPLQVQVGNEPPHPFGLAMLGFFDSERERAYVAAYASISRRVDAVDATTRTVRDPYRPCRQRRFSNLIASA